MRINRMEAIVKLWLTGGRIFSLTDKGITYSRPLDAFPVLLEATPEQRARYEIGINKSRLSHYSSQKSASLVSE